MFIDHSVYLLLGCVIRKRIWNSCLLYRGGHCFPLRLINDPLGIAANRTNKLMQFVGEGPDFSFFFFFLGFNKLWYTWTKRHSQSIVVKCWRMTVPSWNIQWNLISFFFHFFFFLILWKCSKKWNFVLEHYFFLNFFLYFLIMLDRNEIWRFWDS